MESKCIVCIFHWESFFMGIQKMAEVKPIRMIAFTQVKQKFC